MLKIEFFKFNQEWVQGVLLNPQGIFGISGSMLSPRQGEQHSLVTLSVFAFTSTHLRSFCLFISSSSSPINIHISASFISFTLLKVCSSFVRSDVQIILSYRDKGKFYPLSQTWKPRKGKRVNATVKYRKAFANFEEHSSY